MGYTNIFAKNKMKDIYHYILNDLKGFAINLAGNRYNADDLIQETCMKMFLKYPDKDYEEQVKLSCTIMKNIFIDKSRVYKTTYELVDEIKVDNDAWGIMQKKELQKELVNLKSKKLSFIFRLRLDGYSKKDIVDITGVNTNTINSYVMRAKREIIKQLKAA